MKLRERELIHGRWAMLAAVGVLTPECTAKLSLFGTPGQHWWNTSLVFDGANGIWPSLTYLGETIPNEIVWLPILHLPLFVIAESLRTGTYTLERFAHLDRMYPGGKLFDPLGIGANVSDEDLAVLKTIEIQHCRLAMIASFGFIVEALGWGAGPLCRRGESGGGSLRGSARADDSFSRNISKATQAANDALSRLPDLSGQRRFALLPSIARPI